MLLGEGEVVDHRAAVDLDVDAAPDPPGGVEHGVGHPVAAHPAVGHGVQLAGVRVAVRVRGVARSARDARQGAPEVARADGVELVGQLVRRRPGLDQRQGPAGVPEHVGVGREVEAAGGAAHRLAQRLGHAGRAHPAVAVPLRLPVAEPDAVHHALAEEPVVLVAGVVERVGPDPQVAAVEVAGQLAGDGQVGRGQLLADRGEVVAQVAVAGPGGVAVRLVTVMSSPGEDTRADNAVIARP